ncbi:hypothetical protein H257_14775 [Aphanomyces astaci]|uniref:Uncharacterized protein n=1 Tax=Aphanomyces astaci TaxID=112090 RepID=W4FRT2_APHAT|nr:hypothetical protein H257_14775 [Aphanomyces astaci]ETV69539.1 hypothetical protein H257_14775 [Aphanomyces astaci]|eukprot:XP_009840963.1 hypothetical protein H257_14775 [Aphanomyces astaci]
MPINANAVLSRLQEQSIRHFSSWDKHAADFGYKAPTFEKLIMRVLGVIQHVVYDHFIVAQSMQSLHELRHQFEHHPYALYAGGVKFHPSLRPIGCFPSRSTTTVGSTAYTATISKPQRHWTVVAWQCRNNTLAMLTMYQQDMLLTDHGELSAQYREQWAWLIDMGYIGIVNTLHGIHSNHRPVNRALDASDVEFNRLISSDRMIVENYFGWVCALWKASYATFTWSEKNYCAIECTTFALTNFHLSLMPLRLEDDPFMEWSWLVTKGWQMKRQRRYRLNRQERAALDLGRAPRSRFYKQ